MICLSAAGMAVYFGGSSLGHDWPLLLLGMCGAFCVFLRKAIRPGTRGFLLPPGWWIALAILGYALAHVVLGWSDVPYLSRLQAAKLTAYTLILFAAVDLLARRSRWKAGTILFLLLTSALSWYAIIQQVKGQAFVLNIPRPETYGNRASATWLCPNHFAHYIGMGLSLAAGLALMPRAGGMVRLVAMYSICIMLPALFLTESRGGILGTGVGMLVSTLLVASRRSAKSFFVVLILFPLLVGGVGFAGYQMLPTLRERIQTMLTIEGDMRLDYWQDCRKLIEAESPLGAGPGTFSEVFAQHREAFIAPNLHLDHAHNEYLQTLVEYGWVGGTLVFGLLGWVLLRLFLAWMKSERENDQGLIACMIGLVLASMLHSVFDFHFQLMANALAILLLYALLSGRLFASGIWKPIHPPRWVPRLVGILASLALVISAWETGRFFLANRSIRLAEAVEPAAAIEHLEQAYRCAPAWSRTSTLLGYAKIPPAIQSPTEATYQAAAAETAAIFDRAIRLNPLDDQAWCGRAIVHRLQNQPDLSDQAFREAIRLQPFFAAYPFQWGSMLYEDRRWGKAVKMLKPYLAWDDPPTREWRAFYREMRDTIERPVDVNAPVRP